MCGGVWPEGLSWGRGPRWRFGLTSVRHRSPWKLLEGGADLTLHNSIYSLAVRISRTRKGRERLEGPSAHPQSHGASVDLILLAFHDFSELCAKMV